MDRALSIDQLRGALGEGLLLPTPEELQQELAQVEIELFLGRGEVSDDLLTAAWYLHAVGGAEQSLDIYPAERQRQAHQVSAHIFDLALATAREAPRLTTLQLTFAGQIGYLRGELNPNATALYRRLGVGLPRLISAAAEVSLEVGCAFLALDRARLFPLLETLRIEARSLREASGVEDLIETPYGAAARVVEAVREMLVHFTYNRPERLDRALLLLQQAIESPYSLGDVDSRWVAAHLRDVGNDLQHSSVWSLLPTGGPAAAARAMTLGDPPVLSLWPPQYDFLSREPSPLDPSTRRMVLSFPTSGGKTLLAQYIVLAHVAAGAGAACVVVPTNSLAREVRRDLDRRLDLLARAARDSGPIAIDNDSAASVVIMTPEKLLASLRRDPDSLLSRFSLFVVDEAHLVGDRSRGWILESALTFIHERTQGHHHRIILLSAALGNRAHVAAWLAAGEEEVAVTHLDWRGPRRVLSLLSTYAAWDSAEIRTPTRKGGLTRQLVPLYGKIAVRTAAQDVKLLSTTEPIGQLVLVARPAGWERYGESTPGYRMRAEIAAFLGRHGPLLVIEPTKPQVQRVAQAIAAVLGEDDAAEASPLAAIAATRLGDQHPLVSVLRFGVGFHHAGLPDDIQAELEEALRDGSLRYLVATTTLVEGINFPVRTVLIGDRGYRVGPAAEDFVTTIDSARLLNAIGRAGRAGRETEGWVVLWIAKEPEASDFNPLEGSDEDLVAISHIATPHALEVLEEFEDLIRRGQDAVFEYTGREVADFISHVWFIASALEELQAWADNPIRVSCESTLAWQQLDAESRDRWRAVAEVAVTRYTDQPPDIRKRWARTGTSLPSAVAIEGLVSSVAAALPRAGQSGPRTAFGIACENGQLETILSLGENVFTGFRPRRNSPRLQRIDVDVEALTLDWLGGMQLRELCDTHLGSVADETYRYEQLSEFVSGVLEHLFPWVFSTVVKWVNERLPATVIEEFCPALPAFLRFGVDSPPALELMLGGVRSRRLAHVVASRFLESSSRDTGLAAWLAAMDISVWHEVFQATPTELADLLTFTRARDAHLTSRILEGERVGVPIVGLEGPVQGAVDLALESGGVASSLVLRQGGRTVAAIGAEYQDDLRRLLSVGIPMVASVADGTVTIQAVDLTLTPGWFD